MALICSYCGSECSQRDQANGRCGSCACFFTGHEEVIPDAPAEQPVAAVDYAASSPFAAPQPTAEDAATDPEEPRGAPDAPAPNAPAPPPSQFDPTAVEPDSPLQEVASSEGLIQPRRLSPQFRRRVERTWESTFGGGGAGFTAESTLSSHQPSTETKVESPTLSIATRKITKGKGGAKGASEGDYELTDVIGEGSMGRVWSARQTSLDRNVAVKVPMAELAGAGSVGESQFISEVVVTGQLEHPNIVPIYELGRDATGIPFYSMKHVQGRPWNEFIQENTIPENLEILMKVCDAIAFAHDRNFLHRDIKPHNVMVGEFGEVSVMDWGIAVSITKDPNQPWASVATGPAGTPAYMAPEMAAHNPSELGVVSDIYLLGAVLYEIVTGTPPHPRTGDTGEALLAAAANEIIPTTRSGELVDIARRAMATNLEDRYQSVQELQDAIREYQSHRESIKLSESADEHFARAKRQQSSDEFARARFAYEEALKLWDGNTAAAVGMRLSTLEHAKNALAQENYELGISVLDSNNPEHRDLLSKLENKRAARRRLAWVSKIAAGTAIAAILAVVVVTLYFYKESLENADRLKNQRDVANTQKGEATEAKLKAEEERENAELARNEAVRAQREARRLEAEARLEKRRAEEAPYSSNIGLAAESIRRKLRDKAERILDKLDPTKPDADPVMSQMRHIEWGILKHSWSPASVATLTGQDRIEAVASSADGEVLAAGTDNGDVLLWKGVTALDSDAEPITIPFGNKLSAVAVSADGRYLAAAGIRRQDPEGDSRQSDFDVCVWEITSDGVAATPSLLQGHRGEVLSVAFSGDATKVVTSAADRTAVVWDRNTAARLSVMADHLDPKVWSARLSPINDDLVVTACEDGRVRVWLATPKPTGVSEAKKLYDFRGHDGPVYAAVFSPDGRSVLSGGYDRSLLRWKLSSAQADVVAAGTDLLKKRLQGQVDRNQGDANRRDEIGATGDRHTASIRSIAVGRLGDQQIIVTGGNDNTVRVWRPTEDSWKLDKVLSGHGRWVRSCVFSNNGQYVLSGADDGLKLWAWQAYSMPRDLIPDPEVRLSRQPSERGLSSALQSIYSRDGRWIATVYANGTVEVWDLQNPGRATGEMLVQGHAMLAATGVIDPQGERLMTSAGDNTTRLWNVTRGTHTLKLDGTGYRGAADVAWQHDRGNALVVTGSDEHMTPAWFWRVDAQGDVVKTALLGDYARSQLARQAEAVTQRRGATYSPVSVRTTSDGIDAMNRLQRRIPDVTTIKFSPDGGRFMVGDSSGHCFVYQVETATNSPRQLVRFRAHRSAIRSAAFLPSGRSLITAGVDGEVIRWNATDGTQETKLPWSGPVTALDVSAAGDRLLVGHAPLEGTDFPVAELFRLEGDAIRAEASFLLTDDAGRRDWTDNRPTIRSARFVPGTDRALLSLFFPAKSGSDRGGPLGTSRPSRYRIGYWDWNHPDADFAEMNSSQIGEVSTAFIVGNDAPETQLLVVGGKGARLWAADRQRPLSFTTLKKSFRPASKIVAADFSYDPASGRSDRLVVGDSEGNVRVWELDADRWSENTSAAVHLAGQHDGPIVSTFFDPTDPNRMITAERNGTWKLWRFDAQQWHSPLESRGDDDRRELNFAMFSPDGTRILAGTDSGAAVWQLAADGTLQRVLETWQPGKVQTAVYADDGSWIVTCDGDRVVAFWDRRGNLLAQMDREDASGTTAIALSYDRRRLITGQGKGIGIWDTSRILEAIVANDPSQEAPQVKPETIASSGLIKELFTLNKKLFRLDAESEVNSESDITSISISPDGQNLLSSGMNGQTTIWEGAPLYPITFAFSNDQFTVRRNASFKQIGTSVLLSDPSRLARFGGAELTVSILGERLAGETLAIRPMTDLLGATIVTDTRQGRTMLSHRAHHQAEPKVIGELVSNEGPADRLRVRFSDAVDVRSVQALIAALAYRVESSSDDAASDSQKVPSGSDEVPNGSDVATDLEQDAEVAEMAVISRTVEVTLSGFQYTDHDADGATDGRPEASLEKQTVSQTIKIEVEPDDNQDSGEELPHSESLAAGGW
ncbi:Serine/threonine-protein kinase PknD [Stieleria neptunia]|uniref:Serine/threonine-protein kinase PknD n=1 Tax=Stieleria neptunia TaxID=2527979 RepID=A0A518HN02_9BACT|nr:protein kinase [Stieleria neptunia]QDV42147.1 Serine/threonine-protein kinase PknD [Stieleria neptunia]